MKQYCMAGIRLAAVAALMVVAVVCADEKPAPAPPLVEAPRSALPLAVDGVLNEPVWQAAPVLRVDYIDKEPGVLTEPAKMTVKVVWDDYYLYIGYEVYDTDVLAKGSGERQGPADNQREACIAHPSEEPDFVEFFISFDDPNFFWEVHHNAANHLSDIWCTVVDPKWKLADSMMHRWGIVFGYVEYIHDDPPYTLAKAVHMRGNPAGRASTVNSPGDEDAGYSAEIRLPWAGIGTPRSWENRVEADPTRPRWTIPGPWKIAGKQVRILAVCHNGNYDQFYYHSAPTRSGGWFHTSYAHWPVYQFSLGSDPK